MREGATTDDYRKACSGDGAFGSLGYEWADKPHRLVYDLCGEIEQLRAAVDMNTNIAKVLDMLMHMICVLADGEKPSRHDLTVVAELIKDIRDSQ